MKRSIIIIISILVSFGLLPYNAHAEDLKVKSFNLISTDLSASTYPKTDLNGNPCALVKVDFPYEGAAFEGNIVDIPVFKINEYWVYMSPGSKQLRVHTPGHHTLTISFVDFQCQSLESKRTYNMAISSIDGGKPTFKVVDNNVSLYQIHRDSKYGFVDKTGNIVVPTIYEHNVGFDEGLAPVTFNKKVGYIDKSGSFIIQPQFEIGHGFHNGIAVVKTNNKWGAINQYGEIVIPPIYDRAAFGYCQNNRIPMMLNGKYCILDNSGRMLIPPIYDDAWGYSCGMCAVMLDGQRMFIDISGNVSLTPNDETSIIFKCDLLRTKCNGKWGYVNKSGDFVIEPKFDDCCEFSDDQQLASVSINGKYGYINTEGQMLIQPTFEFGGDFMYGYAPVKIDGKYGVINSKGEICIRPQYDSITIHKDGVFGIIDFSHGYFEQYYIDINGRKIADFSDGSPMKL